MSSGPPPKGAQEETVQPAPSVELLKSSWYEGASCTPATGAVTTRVPLAAPAANCAAVDCFHSFCGAAVVKDHWTGPAMPWPAASMAPLSVAVYVADGARA